MCDKLQYRITRDGLEQLRQNLNELREKAQDVSRRLQEMQTEASSLEDLSYSKMINEKMYLQSEILQLQSIIENAKIIRRKKYQTSAPGCTLKLENHELCYIFQLVEPIEANPLRGRVSVESPLGQSVVGKREGEEITIHTPSGRNYFKIVSIF